MCFILAGKIVGIVWDVFDDETPMQKYIEILVDIGTSDFFFLGGEEGLYWQTVAAGEGGDTCPDAGKEVPRSRTHSDLDALAESSMNIEFLEP